jgi:hypothetical protein
MLKAKKKICVGCGKDTYIWSRGRCKQCAAKGAKPLKAKPKSTKAYKGITMLEHTAIYYSTFGYDTGDFIPSELSGNKAVDVHHIIRAGAITYEKATHPLNLMALTRKEHEDYGDRKDALDDLIETHLYFCINKGVDVHKLIDTLPPALERIKIIWQEILNEHG